MSSPQPPADPRIDGDGAFDDSAHEKAFDEYVESALRGDPPDPAQFAASRGIESRALIDALERVFKRSRRSAGDDELPFERIGDYRLIRRLGLGGMGLVFLAEQESLGRTVALKIIRPELQGSAVAAERFQREARAVAQLRHPNIVTVFAAGESHGVRFLAMEWLDGASLSELIERGELRSMPHARKVRWIADLAHALGYAHQHGVIHRDVKPSNIRITPDGRALLLDFGLARLADAGATLTDTFAGSPSHASPEQISQTASVDARTDVYSLGVTLYQCLTGAAPFKGESVEQIFHRILTAEPTPPRTLDPSIPRDLQVVALKAMERDPARRYATAEELAGDLEAVLDLRPIQGRPPDRAERVRRAARRHPVAATALSTGVFAVFTLAGVLVAQRNLRVRERRTQAGGAVERARAKIADYRASRASLGSVLNQVDTLRRLQIAQCLTPAEYALLDDNEAKVVALQRAWDSTFYEVLDLLREAERLDPEARDVEHVRGELYLERYREARDARDEASMEFQRKLVVEHDADGSLSREFAGEIELSLDSDPPGAEVYLFRYADQSSLQAGGDARQVPVPVGDPAPAIAPGTWVLRVVEPKGELERGDLIFEVSGHAIEGAAFVLRAHDPVEVLDVLASIDGVKVYDVWDIDHRGSRGDVDDTGQPPERTFVFERGGEKIEVRGESLADIGVSAVIPADLVASPARPPLPARVVRLGGVLELTLPPALEVRTSATPLLASPACSIGATPIRAHQLPLANYLAVLRKPGFGEQHYTIKDVVGPIAQTIRLVPSDAAPPGFVHVVTNTIDFWMQEREVTAGEYLEFLNDPATLAEIDASPTVIRAPRQFGAPDSGEFFVRAGTGPFRQPRIYPADWPIVGISWNDAVAYAQWMTERARARGLDYTYELPTLEEYGSSGTGRINWRYTWGSRFRAKWARTCFARPSANLGRVMMFPTDESPFGAFDLCGSAFEWLDSWYDEPRKMRQLGGGAWGHADAGITGVWGGYGGRADSTSGETGMRLVLHIGAGDAR